jgi:hypothetical protein
VEKLLGGQQTTVERRRIRVVVRSEEVLAASVLEAYAKAHGGADVRAVDDAGADADFAEYALGIRIAPDQRRALADLLARELAEDGALDVTATAPRPG